MFMPANGFPRSAEARSNGPDGPDEDREAGEERHPGPAVDDAMRGLMEADLPGLCELLDLTVVGELEHLPSELPSRSKRLDLLLRIGPKRLAHVEYAYRGDKAVVPQMMWYRSLIMRKYPDEILDQHIVVLGGGQVRGHDN